MFIQSINKGEIMKKTCNGPVVVPDSDERVILSKFTRIGDRLMMAVSSKDDGWAKRDVLNGVEGTVIGIHRYEQYQGRIGVYRKPPGKYSRNGGAIVRWDNGVFDTPSMHDVVFLDKTLRDSRPEDTAYNEAFDIDQRIGDLPDLPFWEFDRVRLVPEHRAHWDDCDELVVSHISYDYIGDMCNDGITQMPIYQVEPASLNRGRITVRPNDLELIERGNFWWWAHDKTKVKFDDLRSEVAFHKMSGMHTEVRCPQTGHYGWPREHVYEGAKSGLIDVLSTMAGFFGAPPSAHGYKLHDPDLSFRANQALLEGFKP
jgi:hypothetical protein